MDEVEKLLTKADILEGKEKREKVYIKKLGGSLEIRPLTEVEWARVQAMNTRGSSMTATVEVGKGKPKDFDYVMDLEKSFAATSEAERLTVSFGVANITLTPEDVGKLRPAGIAEEIANHILRITGVSLKKTEEGKAKEGEAKMEVVSSFRSK